MAKHTSSFSVIVRFIVALIIVALILSAFAFAYKYLGNGQRNFYVARGGVSFGSDTKDAVYEKDVYTVFHCATLTGQKVSYDVQIFVNTKAIDNFDFTVNGSKKNFKVDFLSYNCGALFNLSKIDDLFVLCVPTYLTLFDVINARYSGSVIEGVPGVPLTDKNSFVLTVTDSVEKLKTEIYFC